MRDPNPEVIPDYRALAGQRVAVAFNLNRCRRGSDPKPGESCFTVLELRASGRPSKVRLGYVQRIALGNIRTDIDRGAFARIQRTEQREVCCTIVGTVIPWPRKGRVNPASTRRATFNPFVRECFYTLEGGGRIRCFDRAEIALFKERSMAVIGPR